MNPPAPQLARHGCAEQAMCRRSAMSNLVPSSVFRALMSCRAHARQAGGCRNMRHTVSSRAARGELASHAHQIQPTVAQARSNHNRCAHSWAV